MTVADELLMLNEVADHLRQVNLLLIPGDAFYLMAKNVATLEQVLRRIQELESKHGK